MKKNSVQPVESIHDMITFGSDSEHDEVDTSTSINFDAHNDDKDGQLPMGTASLELFHHSLKLAACRLLYVSGIVGGFAILGYKDQTYRAASTLLNTSQIVIMYTFSGPINILGIDTRAALAKGENNDVSIIYRQGLKMVIILGVPASLAALGVAPFFRLLGQSSDVVDVIRDYNRFYSIAIPGSMLFLTA